MISIPPGLRLPIYAGGIFICYFLFGIFQEKITRTKYGPDKEMFRSTLSLVLLQCIVNAIFARIIIWYMPSQRVDTTSRKYYIGCAFTYLSAMVTSNMALQHVNYPTQVIGKSCKPIPVMVLGVIYGKKSYPLRKYLFILLIVIGVALFVWKDGKDSNETSGSYGYFLLMFSLMMDGFTGGIQDRMRAEHHSKFAPMMYHMNKWSSLMLLVGVVVTNEMFQFVDFVHRYPQVIMDILMFSCLSCVGQLFIFLTVADFGPLPCSIVTTTRKFFTVLVSIIYFGNPATEKQYIGTALVFLGLTLDTWKGKEQKKPSPIIGYDQMK